MPTGKWGRTWALAAALAALGVGAQEALWRARGQRPHLADDAAAWVEARHSLGRRDSAAVALIGASRMQLACDLEAFAHVFACGKPVQLAIDGSSPLPILENVARDGSFAGCVVCSVTPSGLFARSDEAQRVPERYVSAYEARGPLAGLELGLRTVLAERLVVMRPECSMGRLARGVLLGRWPSRPYLTMRRDRSKPADYLTPDLPHIKASREKRTREGLLAAEPVDMDGLLRRVSDAVRAIRGRGGQVVFVRFPSSGKVLEMEQEQFPRKLYWDIFAAGVPAPAIHFLDYPELAGFECPDGSHLDQRDATLFTKALARILKGVLDTARTPPPTD